jgi:hypothetical protein
MRAEICRDMSVQMSDHARASAQDRDSAKKTGRNEQGQTVTDTQPRYLDFLKIRKYKMLLILLCGIQFTSGQCCSSSSHS